MARIAYFVMAHHKPYQVDWLMEAIYDPRDYFLLHVDAKSLLGLKPQRNGVRRRVLSHSEGRANVRVMPSRFTNWGGWSLAKIQLDAIAMLLRSSADWTHFVNLSGQCYPIRPMAEIRRTLDEAGDRVSVQMRPWATLDPHDWHLKRHRMFETPFRAFILPGSKSPPKDFALEHKGSQWSILSREFCEWAIDSPQLRRIASYLRSSLLTDELVIQALVANGPFRDRLTEHFGREIVWPGPKVMTREDLPRLRSSPALFARKFDAALDAAVLGELAASGGYRPGPLPQ